MEEMRLALAGPFKHLSHICAPKKFQVSPTGFEPMTSSMLGQCFHQLSYEATRICTGQFVGLICERNGE